MSQQLTEAAKYIGELQEEISVNWKSKILKASSNSLNSLANQVKNQLEIKPCKSIVSETSAISLQNSSFSALVDNRNMPHSIL